MGAIESRLTADDGQDALSGQDTHATRESMYTALGTVSSNVRQL